MAEKNQRKVLIVKQILTKHECGIEAYVCNKNNKDSNIIQLLL